jgi:alpha-beta hydrolase superfamily lysophospholipase
MGRFLVLAGAFAASLAVAVDARAGTYTSQELTIPMSDGVPIAATLFTPDGPPPRGGRPAVMLLHGIGQNRRSIDGATGMSVNDIAGGWLASEGYAVLTFDARAHGGSGGLFSLNGPREVADVRELRRWLADRSDVNPSRIGAFGVSLGGGALWRAAVEGVRFGAIVTGVTWTDLYEALLPQDLAKSGAISGFSTSVSGGLEPNTARLLPHAIMGTNLTALREFTEARSARHLLGRMRAPVLMIQGRRDFAFDMEQALSAFTRIRAPKRLYLTGLGHSPATNSPDERPHVLTRMRLWFDRFLKGTPNGIDSSPPIEIAPDPWRGKTLQFRTLPRRKVVSYRLRGSGTIAESGRVVRTLRLPRRPLELFGTPLVQATLSTRTGWRHLVAVLSAVTPGRSEVVVSTGGASTASLGRRPRRVTIRLMSNATLIPAGATLRLTLAATSSPLYVVGVPPGSRLAIGRVTLSLPALRRPISH